MPTLYLVEFFEDLFHLRHELLRIVRCEGRHPVRIVAVTVTAQAALPAPAELPGDGEDGGDEAGHHAPLPAPLLHPAPTGLTPSPAILYTAAAGLH